MKKDDAVPELDTLRRRVLELESDYLEGKSIEKQLRKLETELAEKDKKLTCVYDVARLMNQPDLSYEQVLQGIAEITPQGWKYPEIAVARITLGDTEYTSPNFRQTQWRQTADVMANGKKAGLLEVCYLEQRPDEDEGPFLNDERSMIDAYAGRIKLITERKMAEEQARERQQHLMHLDKMAALGILVSGVAHEINNPNNFIMLNAPLLKEAWESIAPILEEYFDEHGDFQVGGLPYSEMRKRVPLLFSGIMEGGTRIKSIVENLKDYARTGPADLRQMVDFNSVVRSALALLENLIRKSTNSFEVRYGERLPKVRGNYQQLEQVAVNLIQNACESLPGRNRRVLVETRYDASHDMVVLTVVDGGCGISEEDLKHITDPFFTTKRRIGGTGLGLAVSAGIVKSHGGLLTFNSVVDEGTTATLSLPVSLAGDEVNAVQ